MHVAVINLERDKVKRLSMEGQLKALGIKAEFINAVYGRDLPKEQSEAAVARFRWWCAVGRPIQPAEIGCALSHYNIYRSMAESAVCILEDDVVLSADFGSILHRVEDFVNLDRPQVVMLSNHDNCVPVGSAGDIRRDRFAICTDGYVITPAAAKALLKANLPLQVPCDHWHRWERMGIIELYHTFPSVVRQDQMTYGSSTSSGRKGVCEYSLPRYVWHKGKRCVGVLCDRVLLEVGL